MSLLDTQRAFRSYLLDQPGTIAWHVTGRSAPSLAVYHNAYRAQLVAALRDSFERTWAWLGDDGFEAVARAHVAEVPPSSWTLNDYGRGFPDTLARLHPGDPEVAEIAALDWALRRVFDGPDAAPIAPERLASVDWESAVLVLAPTLTTLTVTTNAAALWSAMANGETPPAPAQLPGSVVIRVWRDGLSPRFVTIDAGEVAALAAVQGGATFAGLCEALARTVGVEAAVERAGALLGAWLGDGLVVDIR